MMALRFCTTHPVFRLRNDVDRFLGDVFEDIRPGALLGHVGQPTFPPVNLWEDEGNLYAEVEVPGMKMDDLKLHVIGDELSIKGERKARPEKDVSFYRRERGTGTFSRVFQLPVEVDAENVSATLRDGVLTIVLPKAASVMPRKIEVTTKE